ncbi:MAG TPA: CoA transferase, partial [Dehalococcoidia bacterium]|nr:CoA transferase [Dehalococcoidia bacterium]
PVTTLNRLLAQIVTFLGNKTSREVVSRSSVDRLMMAPGLSTADLREDPQLQARGFWRDDGAVTRPGPFAKLSRTPLTSASAPRQIGQDQALLDELLLPPDDVQAGGPGIVTGGSDSEPVRGDIFGELKVADFTWAAAGPILSRALADHGAMVVHVESEAHVDLARMLPPYKDGQPGVNRSHLAASFNASKFGLTTNFKTPEGLEVIRRLIDWADVVVDNYAPGVLEGAGLTYESLSADRPDLVMLSTTMRGATGPERSYAGYGAQGAALAGLHAITGWPDRFPVGPWGPLTDFIAPRFGLAALAAALRHRERTGEGQFIDLSQVECGIQFIGPLVLDYTVNGKVARARGQESDTACPHGIYATIGDERYVAVAVETPGQWRALVQLAPLADFSDAMFDSLERRITDRSRIEDRVREWCTDQEAGTVTATLRAAGIPASAVLRPGELHQDPQLLHRGFFITADHAVLGATPFDGFVT